MTVSLQTNTFDLLHELLATRILILDGAMGTMIQQHKLDEWGVSFEQALTGLPLPACPTCGRVLKPGVVMFGELLPEEAIGRAVRLASEAGLMLVVGSSLEVYPVAGLPLETLATGGKVAIVNRGATQLDERAAVRIDAGAGGTLSALSERLE